MIEKLSKYILISFFLSIIISVLILFYQVYIFLKFGEWNNISIYSINDNFIPSNILSVDWIGIKNILIYLIKLPVFVIVPIVGFFIPIVGLLMFIFFIVPFTRPIYK